MEITKGSEPIPKIYSEKETIDLIKYYCEMQRITCQLPLAGLNLSDQMDEKICKAIRVECNIEKIIPINKEQFKLILKD